MKNLFALFMGMLISISAFAQMPVNQLYPCRDDAGNIVEGCLAVSIGTGKYIEVLKDTSYCLNDSLVVEYRAVNTRFGITQGATAYTQYLDNGCTSTTLVNDTDTRLDNGRIVGNNLVFDVIDPTNGNTVLTTLTVPNAINDGSVVDNGNGTHTYSDGNPLTPDVILPDTSSKDIKFFKTASGLDSVVVFDIDGSVLDQIVLTGAPDSTNVLAGNAIQVTEGPDNNFTVSYNGQDSTTVTSNDGSATIVNTGNNWDISVPTGAMAADSTIILSSPTIQAVEGPTNTYTLNSLTIDSTTVTSPDNSISIVENGNQYQLTVDIPADSTNLIAGNATNIVEGPANAYTISYSGQDSTTVTSADNSVTVNQTANNFDLSVDIPADSTNMIAGNAINIIEGPINTFTVAFDGIDSTLANDGLQLNGNTIQWANTSLGGGPANRLDDAFNFLGAFGERWQTNGDDASLDIEAASGNVGVGFAADAAYQLRVIPNGDNYSVFSRGSTGVMNAYFLEESLTSGGLRSEILNATATGTALGGWSRQGRSFDLRRYETPLHTDWKSSQVGNITQLTDSTAGDLFGGYVTYDGERTNGSSTQMGIMGWYWEDAANEVANMAFGTVGTGVAFDDQLTLLGSRNITGVPDDRHGVEVTNFLKITNPILGASNGSTITDIDAAFEVESQGNTALTMAVQIENLDSDSLFTIRDDGQLSAQEYGDGVITGTPTFNLQVDKDGNLIESAIGLSSGAANDGIQVIANTLQWGNTAAGGSQPADRIDDSYNFLNTFDEVWETNGNANSLTIDGQTGNVGVHTTAAKAGQEYELTVQGFIHLDDLATNTVIGNEAGRSLQVNGNTGNTILGYIAGQNIVGNDNTLLGNRSGNNLDGSFNVSLGNQMGFNAVGSSNVLIGDRAGTNLNGSTNIVLGQSAATDATGSNNIYMGNEAGRNVTVNDNVFLGRQAGRSYTGNGNSVAIGLAAARDRSGTGGVIIGNAAGLTDSGQETIAIGAGAGQGNLGDFNIIIGNQSVQAPTGASNNSIFIGEGSGQFISGGESVVGLGNGTLQNNSGGFNTAIGTDALNANTTGQENTAVGYHAGLNNTTGSFNTYLGFFAGNENNGSNCTHVGESANDQAELADDNTVIGFRVFHDNGHGSRNVSVGSGTMYFAQSDFASNMVAGQVYIIATENPLAAGTDFTLLGAANNTAGTVFTYNGAPVGGDGTARVRSQDAADYPNENTAIGYRAGEYVGFGNRNVFIGYRAGADQSYTHQNDKLVIANSDTVTPLVDGDFSQQYIKFNTIIGLADGSTLPAGYIPEEGDIRFNGTTKKHQGYDGTVWNDMY